MGLPSPPCFHSYSRNNARRKHGPPRPRTRRGGACPRPPFSEVLQPLHFRAAPRGDGFRWDLGQPASHGSFTARRARYAAARAAAGGWTLEPAAAPRRAGHLPAPATCLAPRSPLVDGIGGPARGGSASPPDPARRARAGRLLPPAPGFLDCPRERARKGAPGGGGSSEGLASGGSSR